jgi:DNA transformation protein and related proteins
VAPKQVRKTARKAARKTVGKTARKGVRKAARKAVRKTAQKATRKSARKAAGKTGRKAAARKTSGAFAHLKVRDSFRDFVLAQLDAFGDVTSRSMFGGIGLYHRGVFFAIVAADVLYFRVDDGNRRDFELRKAPPFQPYAERASTKYFAVPVDILENSDDLAAWARKAVRAASGG